MENKTNRIGKEQLKKIVWLMISWEFQAEYDDPYDYLVTGQHQNRTIVEEALSLFFPLFADLHRECQAITKFEGEDLAELAEKIHFRKIDLRGEWQAKAENMWEVQKGAEEMD